MIKQLVSRLVIMFVIFAFALFLPAGTLSWPAGWIFIILFFGFVVALSLWLLRYNPELMKERMGGLFRSDQKLGDKALLVLANIFFMAWLMLMPLDAVRLRWSHMPLRVRVAGLVLLLCSFCFFYVVFRENPYLSPVVRIQHDRGQTVVSTGPYQYVRHPMYSGFLLFTVGTSLLLGSWLGLLFGTILIGVVARRAVLEERVLREELRGYDAYMKQVRYRLIPRVW